MKFTSVLSVLKSSNAVLCVLTLALLAQMPHAADVFRLTVHGGENIWSTVHSYSYAVALEMAVLLFVVQGRQAESYGFAVVSVLVNLSYYSLQGVQLFSLSAFPAYLVSIALPVAIALYSHVVVESDVQSLTPVQPKTQACTEHETVNPTVQPAVPKRVTRTVRDTRTVEQSEQYTVQPVVPTCTVAVHETVNPTVNPTVQLPDYRLYSDEQKREKLAIVLHGDNVPNKTELAKLFGVSRTTLYSWIGEIEATITQQN